MVTDVKIWAAMHNKVHMVYQKNYVMLIESCVLYACSFNCVYKKHPTVKNKDKHNVFIQVNF